MIFNPSSPMAQRLLMRKSGNILYGSANSSVENIFIGRRRSLSLDDLGLSGLDFENCLGKEDENYHSITSNTGDTDDDDLGEELPYQDDSILEDLDCTVSKGANSLSTIRESSPINSVEEWSPSPPGYGVRAQSSDPNVSLKSTSLSMVQSYLNKWKKKIRK